MVRREAEARGLLVAEKPDSHDICFVADGDNAGWLRENGHDVVRFVRGSAGAGDERGWDPSAHRLDPADLADLDAVVHLAGAGVADKRWTATRKAVVLGSRVDGTTTVARAMAEALAKVTIKAPAAPLVSNVLASAITDPDEIRRRLVEQVTGTVRWRESVAYMAGQGVTRFFEIGAGKVLTGLMKRNAPEAAAMACGTPAEIEAVLKAL